MATGDLRIVCAAEAVDIFLTLAAATDQYGAVPNLMNTLISQDITPSITQQTNGEAAFNTVQPNAEQGYATLSGPQGLEENTDMPADSTRVFIADLDLSRPHYMANHLVSRDWGFGGGAGTTTLSPQATKIGAPGVVRVASDGAQPGFIAAKAAGGYALWIWLGDGEWLMTHTLGALAAAFGNGYHGGTILNATGRPTIPTLNRTGSRLWMGTAAGVVDVYTDQQTAQIGAGGYLRVHEVCQLADRLHAFCQTNAFSYAGITLVPYDVDALGNLTHTMNNAATPAEVFGHISDGYGIQGVAASNGFMIAATQDSVYSVAFNDTTKAYVVSLLDTPGAITSNVVTWQGDVWIGVENRIWRITPGTPNNTWVSVDPAGALAPPYSTGYVVQLMPMVDALYALVVDDANNCGAIVKIDFGGGVATYRFDNTVPAGGFTKPDVLASYLVPMRAPLSTIGGYPQAIPGIAVPNQTAGGTFKLRTDTVLSAGRSARKQAAGNRLQRVEGFALFPKHYGQNRWSDKTPTRIAAEFSDVGSIGANLAVELHWQVQGDELLADTFARSFLVGTGKWTLGIRGDISVAGINPATGNGIVWSELLASNNYLTSTLWVRWLLRVQGDATGAKYPALRGFIWQRLEWVRKFYLSQAKVRMQIAGAVPAGFGSIAKGGGYKTSAAMERDYRKIKALNDHHRPCDIYFPDGVMERAFITKWNTDLTHRDKRGITGRDITISMQHIKPSGLYE